ncbi:MAG: nucleoside triphosphate pyrophosphohydrolase [Clostridia bacterium]|nr:nucleoside triphosphate pyrophosphohydrolase [Clostridia bacterium]
MNQDIYSGTDNEKDAFARLTSIIRILRSPSGCPWDREQTHESLIRGMIEEAYEVVNAIEKGDVKNLQEELGDVLLQVVMHAQISEEAGHFSMTDIANTVSEKMIRRHPHVFGENSPENPLNKAIPVDKVVELWENVKQDEKSTNSQTEEMKSIPRQLPALLRSEKIQAKARRVGFDWDDVSEAFLKVKEETLELEEACAFKDKSHVRDELGDLLFAVVNVARFLDIDPEQALHLTSERFIRRFSYIENQAKLKGLSMSDMTLWEMDRLWEQAKSFE